MSLAQALPSKSGVYLFKNGSSKIIYVGKAKDLKKRVVSYFSNLPHDTKTNILISKINSIEHIITSSEIEAFLLEANLIKKYKPEYNIKFADDKSFPYIKIAKKPIPYITIVRKKDDKNATYFGPFPDALGVRIVLKIIRRIFPYQSGKNHLEKKCLYYHLGLCPCVALFPEKRSDYNKTINKIKSFLKGKKDFIIRSLEKERDVKIKKEEFEEASIIQKKIEKINLITSPQYHPFAYEKDHDLYEKRMRLEQKSLQDILIKYFYNLKYLKRIECFDISNISGKQATGSMVVFTNGESDKKEYRRFRIRSKTTPDDFLMMKEMLTRRLKRNDWGKADLIVVDGGKGQVSSILQILEKLNLTIPLIGLAKREEVIIIPNRNFSSDNLFIEVKLPLTSPALNLLRRIRDEAHRFAITYHRLLRRKHMLLK